MEEEKRKAYSEVVEILKLIENEEKIEKIPFEVIELIKNNADSSYKPVINKVKPLEEQNLRDETYSILAWIASKYWGEDVAVEQSNVEQSTTGDNNDDISNSVLYESSNDNNEELNAEAAVYNDMELQLYELCEKQANLPILRSGIKWYVRVKEKVIKILKMLFRATKANDELN